MRKQITMPNYMDKLLREAAARANNSQSGVIQHALTIYFLMEKHAPDQIKSLSQMIPSGQTQIYDYIQKDQK